MKKMTCFLLALVLVLSLSACTQDGGPVKPHIMYEGQLYEIPEVTTGIVFDDDAEFGAVTIVDADTMPTADGECNIHAQSVQTYEDGALLIVIVDGVQYLIKK